jgi:F-type H+-transporting ATPase subunit delta
MTSRGTARRYARALFDVALAEDDVVAIERQLTVLVDLFIGHADLWRMATNAAVPVTKKRAVVDQLLPSLGVSPVLQKLLGMMATRDRLGLLQDMLEAYRSRLLDHQQVIRADVTTAVPLPADRAAAIEQRIASVTGRTVVMHMATNPAIIGGVVAKIGSTVYDGSVKRQLEIMKERLAGAV